MKKKEREKFTTWLTNKQNNPGQYTFTLNFSKLSKFKKKKKKEKFTSWLTTKQNIPGQFTFTLNFNLVNFKFKLYV